ncbi:MAG: Uma2 family endonuclease [Acidobacteriota bacterium]
MSTITRFVTEDELLRMPDDGNRYELIEGELRQMSPTGYEHGRSTGNLHGLIVYHVRLHKLGDVLAAETGFVVARTEDGRPTIIAPDIAFVAKGRIPPGTDTFKFLELAPDLIVETLSPSDRTVDVEKKIALWLRAGVRLAVVLDPASRSVTMHHANGEITALTDDALLDLEDVIQGFRCKVSDIFD